MTSSCGGEILLDHQLHLMALCQGMSTVGIVCICYVLRFLCSSYKNFFLLFFNFQHYDSTPITGLFFVKSTSTANLRMEIISTYGKVFIIETANIDARYVIQDR